MAKLSQSQVAMYAQSAGLSADRARIAAAIAMAESGGNTTEHNATPPDDSYGLWQINMLGSMGPSRRAKLGISSNEQLYDPATNARAMAMISGSGGNFGPWSTYTSGAYKQYLNGAGDPTATDASATDAGLPNPLAPFENLGDSLRGINALAELGVGAAEWMSNPHNWIRVIQVTVGAVLVGVGISVMTRGTWQPAVAAGTKLATKVAR